MQDPVHSSRTHRQERRLIGIEMLVTGFVTEMDDEKKESYNTHCIMQVCESPSRQLEITLQDSFACILKEVMG